MNIHTKKCDRCDGTGRVPDPVAIGDHLRKKRENAGVSLRTIAKQMNISATYLSDMERGNRLWSVVKVEQYLEILRGV